MLPLMLGAILGALLTKLLAGVPNPLTLSLVLLVIQVPVLVWDSIVTTKMLREGRRAAEQLLRDIHVERGRWN